MGKIIENKSISELSAQIDSYYEIAKFIRFLERFGVKSSKIGDFAEQFEKLKIEWEDIRQLPDKFNAAFTTRGWITFESLEINIIRQSLLLSSEGNFKEAEELLANSYVKDNIELLILSLSSIKKFNGREGLTQRALDHYLGSRYIECVLILLTIIEGFTSDISSNNRSFFADDTDMYAHDSIAGHETGLKELSKVFGMYKSKTNINEIAIPYRNGILHGKELNYDNKLVAAKLWSTLFAIWDWYITKNKLVQGGYKKSFRQVIVDFAKWNQLKRKIDIWQPREISCSISFSDLERLEQYEPVYPERAVVMLFKYWKSKNYKEVGLMLTCFVNYSESKLAGNARNIFSDTKLLDFRITKIVDQNIMSCNIYVQCEYEKQHNLFVKDLKMEMLYMKGSDPTFRLDEGKWTIMERSFSDL